MPSEKRTSNESGNEYDQLGKKILKIDRAILSLTINDDKGEVFGKAFTKEYERKYMDAAKDLRSRAGLFSALIFGIAAEPEKVFGQTQAIVRMYSGMKLILIPFSNRKLMATLLTKNRADSDQLIKEISPLLKAL
ncbi:MAG TPA: hypothetical protein VED17_09165 [Nitrososphaerales archaeon]|nr:hypothetical protein [Nitrososphaerales archaeon]